MSVHVNSLNFPGFYQECAYRDGMRDCDEYTSRRLASYYLHGEPEPDGCKWYHNGFNARRLNIVHGVWS